MSTLFSGHYLRNRSTLDIGVLGYIGILKHKEHSPEVWSVPPVTPCIQEVTVLDTTDTSLYVRKRNKDGVNFMKYL